MAAITAGMVGELRAKTDAPMMECKKALTEADGDMVRAEEILRVKLGNKAGKAASRITAEGVIAIAAAGSTGRHRRSQLRDRLRLEERLVPGLHQEPGRPGGQQQPDRRGRAVGAAAGPGRLRPDGGRRAQGPDRQDRREHVAIRRFKRFAGDQKLATYLHGTRIGVVVEFTGDDVAAKDVAMHVAAMKPVAVSSANVPAELVEKERKIAAEKAAESGKPAEIVAKMVEGSVQKYLKEVSLFNQTFVKNDKQTVEQMLKAANTQVAAFTMYIVGEGIEKKVDDFAAEVAAQVAAAKGA